MPSAPLRVCRFPGCRARQRGSWCATHFRVSPRNHGGVPRSAREHGRDYDQLARELRGQPCALRLDDRCTGVATGADLIVPRSAGGHAVRSNARPACAHCQSVQGGRLARLG